MIRIIYKANGIEEITECDTFEEYAAVIGLQSFISALNAQPVSADTVNVEDKQFTDDLESLTEVKKRGGVH